MRFVELSLIVVLEPFPAPAPSYKLTFPLSPYDTTPKISNSGAACG